MLKYPLKTLFTDSDHYLAKQGLKYVYKFRIQVFSYSQDNNTKEIRLINKAFRFIKYLKSISNNSTYDWFKTVSKKLHPCLRRSLEEFYEEKSLEKYHLYRKRFRGLKEYQLDLDKPKSFILLKRLSFKNLRLVIFRLEEQKTYYYSKENSKLVEALLCLGQFFERKKPRLKTENILIQFKPKNQGLVDQITSIISRLPSSIKVNASFKHRTYGDTADPKTFELFELISKQIYSLSSSKPVQLELSKFPNLENLKLILNNDTYKQMDMIGELSSLQYLMLDIDFSDKVDLFKNPPKIPKSLKKFEIYINMYLQNNPSYLEAKMNVLRGFQADHLEKSYFFSNVEVNTEQMQEKLCEFLSFGDFKAKSRLSIENSFIKLAEKKKKFELDRLFASKAFEKASRIEITMPNAVFSPSTKNLFGRRLILPSFVKIEVKELEGSLFMDDIIRMLKTSGLIFERRVEFLISTLKIENAKEFIRIFESWYEYTEIDTKSLFKLVVKATVTVNNEKKFIKSFQEHSKMRKYKPSRSRLYILIPKETKRISKEFFKDCSMDFASSRSIFFQEVKKEYSRSYFNLNIEF